MTLRFETTDGASLVAGVTIYRADDFAFDFEPRPIDCVASVTINELEVVLGEDDLRLVFVTGYCPHTGWKVANLSPPSARRGIVVVRADAELTAGIPISVTGKGERWPVAVDPSNGWVCVGDPRERAAGIAVEFAPGSVAVLDDGVMKALWLHPLSLPASIRR